MYHTIPATNNQVLPAEEQSEGPISHSQGGTLMPTEELGRVFAYHRDSPFDDQDVEDQLAEYRATAAMMGREYVGCIHEDDASVKTTPCHERPGFRKLLEEVRPGDELLVWRIVALGSDVEAVVCAMGALAERGANLRVLNSKIEAFCITPTIALVASILLPAMTRWFEESHRETTRQRLAWRRQHGFVTKPVPGYGKRFAPLNGGFKTCRGTPTRIEIWDAIECAQIREIRRRRLEGEPYASIARDFCQRGERRSNGSLWAKYRGSGKKRRIDIQRIRSADRFYMALRSEGKELGFFS